MRIERRKRIDRYDNRVERERDMSEERDRVAIGEEL